MQSDMTETEQLTREFKRQCVDSMLKELEDADEVVQVGEGDGRLFKHVSKLTPADYSRIVKDRLAKAERAHDLHRQKLLAEAEKNRGLGMAMEVAC